LWQDCWDYELVTNPGPLQYNGSNPNPKGGQAKCDPNTNIVFDVGIDTPMTYWWRTSKTGTGALNYLDTYQFPQASWPTPRDMLSTGSATTPGYDNIYYVYGPDNLVDLMESLPGSFCTSNTAWRLVNQPYKKRDVVENDNPYKKNHHEENAKNNVMNKWKEFSRGREHDHEGIWKDLVDWDCQSRPIIDADDNFFNWLTMNGLVPESFDTECDKVSERFYKKYGKDALVSSAHAGWKEGVGAFISNIPLVVIGSVVGVLVLIGIAAGVRFYVQKSNRPDTTDYVEYNM